MLALESTDGNSHITGVDVFEVLSGNVSASPVASGQVQFTDVDTADTHTATELDVGTGYLGTFTLDDPHNDNSHVTETNGSGTVGWHFNMTSQQFDSLGTVSPNPTT